MMNIDKHSRLRSKVWLSFTISEFDDGKAICKVCDTALSRGKNGNHAQCTTALWKHLKNKHPEVCKILSEIRQEELGDPDVVDTLSTIVRSGNKSFKSNVWRYFLVDAINESVATCRECNTSISRGVDRNTTSMWNHLRLKHPKLYSLIKNEHESEEAKEKDRFPVSVIFNVKEEFQVHNMERNHFICKTCGTIVRLEGRDDKLNAERLEKHLDNMFHKRVLHGLEKPKRLAAKNKVNVKTEEELLDLQLQKLPDASSLEDALGNRDVDMIHSSILAHTLLAQQRRDVCCDFTILVPYNERKMREKLRQKKAIRDEQKNILYYETNMGYEFKLHSCIAGIVSGKMKTLLESGSMSLMITNINKDAMLSFIEIAYHGKLKNMLCISKKELRDIYAAAKTLDSQLVCHYLEREHSEIEEEYKIYIQRSINIAGRDEFSDNSLAPKDITSQVNYAMSLFSSSNGMLDAKNGNSKTTTTQTYHLETVGEPSASGLSLLDLSTLVDSNSIEKKRSTTPLRNHRRKRRKQISVKHPMTEADCTFTYSPCSVQNCQLKFEIKGDTAILLSSPGDGRGSTGFEPETSDFQCQTDDTQFNKKETTHNPAYRLTFSVVIRMLRLSLFNEIDAVEDEKIPYVPGLTVKKSWLDKLHIARWASNLTEIQMILACMSRRCWGLCKEIVGMSDIPDKEASWEWVQGLSEEILYHNLILMYKWPFPLFLNHITVQDSSFWLDGVAQSPIEYNKHSQTDISVLKASTNENKHGQIVAAAYVRDLLPSLITEVDGAIVQVQPMARISEGMYVLKKKETRILHVSEILIPLSPSSGGSQHDGIYEFSSEELNVAKSAFYSLIAI